MYGAESHVANTAYYAQYFRIDSELTAGARYGQLNRLSLDMEHSPSLRDRLARGEVLAEMGAIQTETGNPDKAKACLLQAGIWNENLLATHNLKMDTQYRLLSENIAIFGRLRLLEGTNPENVATIHRMDSIRLLDDAYTTFFKTGKGYRFSHDESTQLRGIITELAVMSLLSGSKLDDGVFIAWPSWERQNHAGPVNTLEGVKNRGWDITAQYYIDENVHAEAYIQVKSNYKDSFENLYEDRITLVCGDSHMQYVNGSAGGIITALTSPYPTQTQQKLIATSTQNILDDLKLAITQ